MMSQQSALPGAFPSRSSLISAVEAQGSQERDVAGTESERYV